MLGEVALLEKKGDNHHLVIPRDTQENNGKFYVQVQEYNVQEDHNAKNTRWMELQEFAK